MPEVIWGGFLFLCILFFPILVIGLVFRLSNKRRIKMQPQRDKAAAKAAIYRGMIDQQVHKEAMTEVLAEGAGEIERELRIRRAAEAAIRKKPGSELNA